MMPSTDGPLAAAADALLVYFAMFTAIGHLAYFAGWSMAQWWTIGWFSSVVGAGAWIWFSRPAGVPWRNRSADSAGPGRLTIPAAMLHWIRATSLDNKRSMFLLACAIVGGTGFSPTGIPAGVFLPGLFWLATLLQGGATPWRRQMLLLLPLIAAYPELIGLTLRTTLATNFSGVATDKGTLDAVSTVAMQDMVLGHGVRSIAAVVCAVALPFLLRASPARRPLAIFSVLCTGLFLLPWTSDLLAQLSQGSFAWRWMFVIPFVPAIAVAIDRLAGGARPRMSRLSLAAGAALIFVVASPRWVISERNYTRLSWPAYKLADGKRIHLRTYSASADIEGGRLISPASGKRL